MAGHDSDRARPSRRRRRYWLMMTAAVVTMVVGIVLAHGVLIAIGLILAGTAGIGLTR
jgi:uncharacterized membrane protein SpoIIM required for sporulation